MLNGFDYGNLFELIPKENDEEHASTASVKEFHYKNGKVKCSFKSYRRTLHNEDGCSIIIWDKKGI